MIGYQLKKEDNRWINSSHPTQDEALKKSNSDLSDGARSGSVARPSRLPYDHLKIYIAMIDLSGEKERK